MDSRELLKKFYDEGGTLTIFFGKQFAGRPTWDIEGKMPDGTPFSASCNGFPNLERNLLNKLEGKDPRCRRPIE